MGNNFTALQHGYAAEDRRLENQAIIEALASCDESTYQSVISLLEEAGLLL